MSMLVLADDVVEGHRVVTYKSDYGDNIMAAAPYRTEVVEPGQMLPSYGIDHANEEGALRAHRDKIAMLRGR